MNSQKKVKNVNESDMFFNLFMWRFHRSECFSDRLFDLMAKADPVNLRRLECGFPLEVHVFREWLNNSDEWLSEKIKKTG